MKIFLLALGLILILCTQTTKVISQNVLVNQFQVNNLGFINSTGGVTDQMLATYVKVINEAANLFKDDVKANLRYIKEKLDDAYGMASQYYHVFIQTNIPEYQNYSIWMSVNRMCAGLNNVNLINPSWSYLILKTYGPQKIQNYTYLQNGIYGPAMTSGARLVVKHIVETFQTEECTCEKQSVYNIRKSLESYYGCYQFNVICDSNGLTSALAYAQDGLYGTYKGKCFYTFYKNL